MRDDFERGFSAEPRCASRRLLEPLGEGAVVFNTLLVFAGLIPQLPVEALSHATGITLFSQVIFQQLDPLPFDLGSTVRFSSPGGEVPQSHSGPRLKPKLRKVYCPNTHVGARGLEFIRTLR